MKHEAILTAACTKCHDRGDAVMFRLEIELAHPSALFGVKLTCPLCGTVYVWTKPARAGARVMRVPAAPIPSEAPAPGEPPVTAMPQRYPGGRPRAGGGA